MTRRPPRNHSAAFNAKVALAAIKGEKTLAGLAEQFDIHPNQVTQWKSQLLEAPQGSLAVKLTKGDAAGAVDIKTLHAKLGSLALENDFLVGRSPRRGCERKAMIDREHDPSSATAIDTPNAVSPMVMPPAKPEKARAIAGRCSSCRTSRETFS